MCQPLETPIFAEDWGLRKYHFDRKFMYYYFLLWTLIGCAPPSHGLKKKLLDDYLNVVSSFSHSTAKTLSFALVTKQMTSRHFIRDSLERFQWKTAASLFRHLESNVDFSSCSYLMLSICICSSLADLLYANYEMGTENVENIWNAYNKHIEATDGRIVELVLYGSILIAPLNKWSRTISWRCLHSLVWTVLQNYIRLCWLKVRHRHTI